MDVLDRKLIINKCIFSYRGGKVFHYWKKVDTLKNKGVYIVEEWVNISGDEFRDLCYIFHDKMRLDNFAQLVDLIEVLEKQKLRDIKINKIL